MNKPQSLNADAGLGPVYDKVQVEDWVEAGWQNDLECREINIHEFKSQNTIGSEKKAGNLAIGSE